MATVRKASVIKEPICFACTHLIYWPYCAAYPDGIPEAIRLARSDHKEPMAGDHGVQFERAGIENEKRKEFLEIDAATWAHVHSCATEVARWVGVDKPVLISCEIDGVAVAVKGMVLGQILEIGPSADLEFLVGYADSVKGGPTSGNWGHTSETRRNVGPGGSDPGGGAIDNPLGYLAAYRRALREGSEIRRKVADELAELHPEWTDENLEMALGVMELDRDKFMYYADKWGLGEAGNVDDIADAFFKEEKGRDRAWYQKKMGLEERAVMPHPEGSQYKLWMAEIGGGLYDAAKEGPRLGADLAEARDLFQRSYGLQVNVGPAYDEATAHEELSWLAHMMDADPKLRTIYTRAFKSIRFHNERHGTAAMQVNGRQVSVYPTLHAPGMWYHEAGHGLETLASEAGAVTFAEIGPLFGRGRLASSYSLGNHQEDFAEAWVLMGSGYEEEYTAWAPGKAAIVRRAMGVLHD
jgi:hypothetical protein